MTTGLPLTRLLKKPFLRSYLEDALALFGEGCSLAVIHTPDSPVLAGFAGPADEETLLSRFVSDSTDPDCIRELTVVDTVCGWLLLDSCDGASRPQLDFVARSLCEIMQREFVRRGLGAETLDQYREVALMQRAVAKLNVSLNVRDVALALLGECMATSFPAQHVMVFFRDEENEPFHIIHALSTRGVEYAQRIAESRLFTEILAHDSQNAKTGEHHGERTVKGEIVNDLSGDDRWDIVVPGVNKLLIVPLATSHMVHGALVMVASEDSPTFESSHLKRITTLASVTGIAMANAHHFQQVQKILIALIQSIATAIDSRDRLTSGHSQRVARIAHALARAVNRDRADFADRVFNEVELEEIFYAGLLHDVGKIGVREEVLTKASRLPAKKLDLIGLRLQLWAALHAREWQELLDRLQAINTAYDLSQEDEDLLRQLTRESFTVSGRTMTVLGEDELQELLTPRGTLNAEEWAEIKRHPQESHRILENIPFTDRFPRILDIIIQHHERLDGSGYPAGLAGENVLLQSRILAVADVYDSLCRDRHYKKAFSREKALAILEDEGRLGKLDPRVVRVLVDSLDAVERAQAPEPLVFSAG